MVGDHLLHFSTPRGETHQAERFDLLDEKVRKLKEKGLITTSMTNDDKGIIFGDQDELHALCFIHHLMDSNDNSPMRGMITRIMGRYAGRELSLDEAREIWNNAAESLAGESDPLNYDGEGEESDWLLSSLKNMFEPAIETLTNHAKTQEILGKWK